MAAFEKGEALVFALFSKSMAKFQVCTMHMPQVTLAE